MRRSGNDELQRTGTPADPQLAQAYTALLRQQSRAEEQSHWDSDTSSIRFRESRRMRCGFSDTSSRNSVLQERRFHRRAGIATERRRYALRAACSRLRAVGVFMRNGRNKTKRMLAMWLRTNENMNLDVVHCIGEYCWKDGWRGVTGDAGSGGVTRISAVEAKTAETAASTRLAPSA